MPSQPNTNPTHTFVKLFFNVSYVITVTQQTKILNKLEKIK